MLIAIVLGGIAVTTRGQAFDFVSAYTDVGKPSGLSLDTVGGATFLYVSDHAGGRIFKFDLASGVRTQIAGPGEGDGQFRAPDALAIDPTTHDLYIPDRQLHRVTRLKNTGEFVMKWGGTGPETNRFGFPGAGSARGQFNGPQGAVVDPAGNVYITEHENHRVQKFRITQNAGGWNVEVLAAWGGGGSSAGQFNTPYGITLDAAGNVWVADGFNSRLQRFTPNGDFLGQFPVRGATEPHLVATWLAFDAAGDVYVSITSDPNTGGDIANQRIEKFSPAGASLARWGSNGSGPGQFRLPFGLAIDRATYRAYVADYDNGRVQVFALSAGPPAPPPPAGGLSNVSSRLRVSAGDATRAAIAGFVIGGAAQTTVLVRAVGPGLASFGVTDALANPRLQIVDSAGRFVMENDNWVATAELAAATERVGAFKLSGGSSDAAVLTSLAPGAYTAQVTSSVGNGIALIEVYDAAVATTARPVVNLSTRGFVDTGDGQMVAGFVVTGTAARLLLIRALGPGLAPFGVSNTLADPVLRILGGNTATVLAQNDNWESPQAPGAGANAAEIAAANRTAGAFALTSGSRDAAVIVTLPPGAYTAVVSGTNGGTGTALVEVYDAGPP